MKNDFKKMEEEMDNLSIKMSAITAFNDKISNTLQDKRLQITKLSGVHALLRKVGAVKALVVRKQELHESSKLRRMHDGL